jgi:NhaP-type Na+/H+ or K+/H+ antiporter
MFESTAAAVLLHFIWDMPWALAYACGFMMGAVSPAVVVPSCIRLRNQGYGLEKAVPSIVIAAASLDDILAISLFGVCLGIAMSGAEAHGFFGDDPLINSVITGPFEILGGICVGILIGLIVRM